MKFKEDTGVVNLTHSKLERAMNFNPLYVRIVYSKKQDVTREAVPPFFLLGDWNEV
ncbi:MAG: hypothetical protein HQL04_02455 [Nitrospirae bacterium]|nr:hypothetical protein [Nitrospirota bacterium]